MTGRWFWPVVDAALNAVADGIDLAARTLCPMDHTPPNLLAPPTAECACPTVECPLRAEDICDEADGAAEDLDMHPDAVYGRLYVEQARRRCTCAKAPFNYCPVHGASMPGVPHGDPNEPPTNYLEPVCVTCGKQDWAYPEAYLSRAEGTQRADSSGEVGGHESPSPERPNLKFPEPAEMSQWPDSLLLTHAANNVAPYTLEDAALIAELRDRAAQFEALERTFATNPEK